MNRRTFLTAVASLSAAGLAAGRAAAGVVAEGPFEVMRSTAEWRAMLTGPQYAVMREGDTERPYSSPLNDETRAGIYHCRGCGLGLYSSQTKYDSGTGWPSFWDALPNAIGTMEDNTLFRVRIECHCRRCGSHLGHIFNDGPRPTGKRHCLNGVSLIFQPA